MKSIKITLLLFLSFVIALNACERFTPKIEASGKLDSPTEGLSQDQLRNHLKGDEEFGRIFSVADGLGPIYVSNSCQSCHAGDGKGHPLTTLSRFGRMESGGFNPLIPFGGPQLQQFSIAGYPAEIVPTEATGVAKFLPPAVTGLGFLAGVSDADIQAMADPNDSDGDGVSGVPNYIHPPDFFTPQPFHLPQADGKYMGRFGRKAGAIDLLQQTVGAYINDMGMTTDFHTADLSNVQVGAASGDDVPDPEVSGSTVHNVVFYLRTLKVPPRRNENNPDVKAGELLFGQIGCAACHKPTLKTARSDIKALSEKEFHPYTDLLLHDMGNEMDDRYTEGTALTAEWRTTPLWGLGLSPNAQGGSYFLMHDGRATTIRQAIEFHGGEGAKSREAFRALTETQKQQLVKFLESL